MGHHRITGNRASDRISRGQTIPPATQLPATRPFSTPQVDADDKVSPKRESAAQDFNFSQVSVGNESRSALSMPVQPKLTVGAPNDKYEQEADRVAHDVVQRIHSGELDQQDSVQRSSVSAISAMKSQPLQRNSSAPEGDVDDSFERSLNQARGGGQALAPQLQAKMGAAMGADFSQVRIHTNANSDQLNRSIQAKAFATGQDVFFKQGAYNPSSRSGQELIAHELTHVVQQRGSGSTINCSILPTPMQTLRELKNLKLRLKYKLLIKKTTSKKQDPLPALETLLKGGPHSVLWKDLYNDFKQHLAREFSSENIKAYEIIVRWRASQKRADANLLWNKYVKEDDLNVTSDSRNLLARFCESSYDKSKGDYKPKATLADAMKSVLSDVLGNLADTFSRWEPGKRK